MWWIMTKSKHRAEVEKLEEKHRTILAAISVTADMVKQAVQDKEAKLNGQIHSLEELNTQLSNKIRKQCEADFLLESFNLFRTFLTGDDIKTAHEKHVEAWNRALYQQHESVSPLAT